jgi:hypothetical protein
MPLKLPYLHMGKYMKGNRNKRERRLLVIETEGRGNGRTEYENSLLNIVICAHWGYFITQTKYLLFGYGI